MYRILALSMFCILPLFGIEYQELTEALGVPTLLHNDLNLHTIQGKSSDEEVTICCHGYGGDYQLGYALKESDIMHSHVVSFNFPDFGPDIVDKDPNSLCFGSIEELLPLIYVMKECVISAHQEKIHLYGFSAGGGAIVNALAVLAGDLYTKELKMIGVDKDCREKILSAAQRGNVVLDCPLKSVEEIIADRGMNPQLQAVQKQSNQNNLRPIDSLRALEPLSLNILLHFQHDDLVLSNRDDALYIDRLKKANHKGSTFVVMGADEGHFLLQPSLKAAYKSFFVN